MLVGNDAKSGTETTYRLIENYKFYQILAIYQMSTFTLYIRAVAAAVDITYLSFISLMKGEAVSSPLQAVITRAK